MKSILNKTPSLIQDTISLFRDKYTNDADMLAKVYSASNALDIDMNNVYIDTKRPLAFRWMRTLLNNTGYTKEEKSSAIRHLYKNLVDLIITRIEYTTNLCNSNYNGLINSEPLRNYRCMHKDKADINDEIHAMLGQFDNMQLTFFNILHQIHLYHCFLLLKLDKFYESFIGRVSTDETNEMLLDTMFNICITVFIGDRYIREVGISFFNILISSKDNYTDLRLIIEQMKKNVVLADDFNLETRYDLLSKLIDSTISKLKS